MTFPVTKSLVSKILPLSPFAGKIWREFPATTMIPQDRGGGGYIERDSVFAASAEAEEERFTAAILLPLT